MHVSIQRLQHAAVQGTFLFTGIFSTCTAQFVFYQGAGGLSLSFNQQTLTYILITDQRTLLLPLCNYLGMMLVGLIPEINEPDHCKSSTPSIFHANTDTSIDVESGHFKYAAFRVLRADLYTI